MRLKGFFGLCLSLLLLLASQARADNYFLTITNSTGFDILYAYVSPGDSEDWEEDVLGNDILEDGASVRVTLRGYDSPLFDVRLVDVDGDSYTFWGVNVAKQDLDVTLDHLD